MLDVHPPHQPTHTWRDLFTHIAPSSPDNEDISRNSNLSHVRNQSQLFHVGEVS
jgi:hypothetical protein